MANTGEKRDPIAAGTGEPGREGFPSQEERAATAEGGERPEGHRIVEGPYSGGDPDLENPEGDVGGVFAEGSGPTTGSGTGGGSTGSGDFGSDGAGVGAGGPGGGVGKKERDADREGGADIIPVGEGGI